MENRSDAGNVDPTCKGPVQKCLFSIPDVSSLLFSLAVQSHLTVVVLEVSEF